MSTLKSEHLIFDGQIFQTGSWHRGMGKYSYSLIVALIKKQKIEDYQSIAILLNQNLKAEDRAIEMLQKISPRIELLYVNLEIPSDKKNAEELRDINKFRLSEALTKKGIGDRFDYFILALFLDETWAVFPDMGRKLLLFYDLIPFLYPERYKNVINYPNYLKHFATIFEAEAIFTISQTVADDLKVYLGLLGHKIHNIDGASIDRASLADRPPAIGISENFILMPSGDEQRKNNKRAVKGFELFNAAQGNKYKLVISSRFGEGTQEELSRLSPNVVFTGNIPEEELQWLYKHADLLLFASEYEGLGLPVLEGMSTGRKIACSDIPVFKEISNKTFYFFDHFDPRSIASTLAVALADQDWKGKSDQYPAILKKYSWEETANKVVAGLEKLLPAEQKKKPKIAVFTPHPSGFSAIGKVVAESHDAFSQQFDVEYYFDYTKGHIEVRVDYLSSIAPCYDAKTFNVEKYAQYDAVVYHIGNSPYHFESIRNSLYLPGYVILHDTFLEGVFLVLERSGYLSTDRMELERKLNEVSKTSTSSFLTSIVNNQLGIITHSKYAAAAVKELLETEVPVQNLNLPTACPTLSKKKGEGTLQIGLAGIIHDVKGLSIIEKIASTPELKDCVINIFGHSILKPEIKEQFEKWPQVKVIPDPTDFEFQTSMSKLDVLVNYRLEYRGETSLTTLEAMRHAVSVIVRDIGWYSELPVGAVIKAVSEEGVVEGVYSFYQDRALLSSLGEEAKRLIQAEFSHEGYAREISTLIAQSKVQRTAIKEYEENIKTNTDLSFIKEKTRF